jgi:hypothetical protein
LLPFIGIGISDKEIVREDRVENGIAKIFEPFVVDSGAVGKVKGG